MPDDPDCTRQRRIPARAKNPISPTRDLAAGAVARPTSTRACATSATVVDLVRVLGDDHRASVRAPASGRPNCSWPAAHAAHPHLRRAHAALAALGKDLFYMRSFGERLSRWRRECGCAGDMLFPSYRNQGLYMVRQAAGESCASCSRTRATCARPAAPGHVPLARGPYFLDLRNLRRSSRRRWAGDGVRHQGRDDIAVNGSAKGRAPRRISTTRCCSRPSTGAGDTQHRQQPVAISTFQASPAASSARSRRRPGLRHGGHPRRWQ